MGNPGCHLCDLAAEVIERVCGDVDVAWEEVGLHSDPDLAAAYRDHIPVTFVDGVQVAIWRVNEGDLRRALARE